MNNKEKEIEEQEGVPSYIGHRQRLKARFLSDLGRSMPDYEMLELILMYALPRKDVKPLAKDLIKEHGNLASVLTAPADELLNISGVGSNVATLFSLIHACSNKICWEHLKENKTHILSDKNEILEFCRSKIGYAKQENVLVIYLGKKGKYIKHSIEQIGTTSMVMINSQGISRNSLICNAEAVIICHNHPSGNCSPSRADIEMTIQLKSSLDSIGIKLTDHIIISPTQYYSFAEKSYFMQ
ncbi:MAG: DNA repair protein RadC [Alphaproteobacteria bacterium]|nr:DNA repair protein RadC [Alphaproteobacteria bacterium]